MKHIYNSSVCTINPPPWKILFRGLSMDRYTQRIVLSIRLFIGGRRGRGAAAKPRCHQNAKTQSQNAHSRARTRDDDDDDDDDWQHAHLRPRRKPAQASRGLGLDTDTGREVREAISNENTAVSGARLTGRETKNTERPTQKGGHVVLVEHVQQ